MISRALHIPKANFFKTEVSTSRNIGLDILRAICAILVVLSHSNNILGNYTSVYRIIFPLGYFAQDVFFSLSGFLICNQLINYSALSFKNYALLKFYKNRWFRTIPFYFIFLLINFCLYIFIYRHSSLNYLKTDFNLLNYFTFTQNLSSPHPYFYPEIWPISIEEWSYLFLPLPFLLISKFKSNNINILIVTLILLVLLVNILRINGVFKYNPEQDWGIRKIVLYRLDAILYGAVIALLMNKFKPWFSKKRILLLILGFIIGTTLNLLLIKTNNSYSNSFLFLLCPIAGGLIIPYFNYTPFSSHPFNKLFTHISLISYSILLCHLYFIQFSLLLLFHPNNTITSLIVTLLYFISVLLFSTFFYNYIERPILLLRKK
ncbi:MAG: acyltransferase [Bacteroidota bacterium]|nr:acyltransferase [Bacteroidota bacterium]